MKKRSRILLLALLICAMSLPMIAEAGTPYKTYTVDGYGYVTETQTAYSPLTAITKVGETSFVRPVDMSLSKEGILYIADAGAKLILICDLEGKEVGRIGEGILSEPTGVYVSANNTVYVADRAAKRVFVFDSLGNLKAEYGKPNSPIYGDNMDFKPLKVVANGSGTM